MPLKTKYRFILDGPRRATLSMAIDEVLMESQKATSALPTLRIYFWDRPSITAGYFQDIHKIARRYRCKTKHIPVVRRLTGGGLVLHGKDLTFSLSLKNPNDFLPQDTKLSYQKINEALYEGLRHCHQDLSFVPSSVIPSGRGLDARACFDKPTCFDLLWRGKKAVGASQRRTQGMLLHQSSVFFDTPAKGIIEGILRGFESEWGVRFSRSKLTAQELKKAYFLEKTRYRTPEWSIDPDLIKKGRTSTMPLRRRK